MVRYTRFKVVRNDRRKIVKFIDQSTGKKVYAAIMGPARCTRKKFNGANKAIVYGAKLRARYGNLLRKGRTIGEVQGKQDTD